MNALIHAHSMGLIRQQHTILRDISLEVGRHDFLTVIGPNGAGKSMLLKCLIGLITPTSGQVVREKSLRVGYVPQQFMVDRMIPIQVRHFLRLRKLVNDEELTHVSEEVGIEGILSRQLSDLSGGELQRVLLARALLNNPQLLMLDEPAQHLDVSGQLALYALLDRIYEVRKLSIIMVSHDLHLVMASTRQVICLFEHICCFGQPQTVAKDPEFVALFGEELARRMAVYHHEHNHSHDGQHTHG